MQVIPAVRCRSIAFARPARALPRKTTYHTSVVLEVEEDAVETLPRLGLADNDGRVDLLPELRLSLLDCGHHHVADTASGQPVEAGTDTLDGDDVEVACARVVTAVHDGTAVFLLVSVPIFRIFGSGVDNRSGSAFGIVMDGIARTLGDPGSS